MGYLIIMRNVNESSCIILNCELLIIINCVRVVKICCLFRLTKSIQPRHQYGKFVTVSAAFFAASQLLLFPTLLPGSWLSDVGGPTTSVSAVQLNSIFWQDTVSLVDRHSRCCKRVSIITDGGNALIALPFLCNCDHTAISEIY